MRSETVGNYRLLGLLASGGMGEVFLAEQEGPHGFRRRVVVKRLLRHLASDPSFIEMFLNEARIAALIAHPNVAQIVELGEADGSYFIAMEYVRGQSLRRLLKTLRAQGESLPVPIAVRLVIGVLHGLAAAHTLTDDEGNARGCVHRDVSPENVLLSIDGAVKLVDFGIAKALNASSANGTALRGKYGYLAPEQYRHERLDARTDVFACGVVLFELITGGRPFVADNEAALMNFVLNAAPPPFAATIDCPPRLEAVVTRALAKDPEERFPTALAMASELEALLASGEIGGSDGALRDFARTWISEPESLDGGRAGGPRTEALAIEGALPTAATMLDMSARSTSRRRWFVSAGAIAIVGTVLAVALRRPHTAPEPEPAPARSRTPEAASAPAPATLPIVPSSEAISPASSSPSSSSSVSVAAPPAKHGRGTKSAPAAEKSAAAGTLAFRVRPWAEIVVDGRSLGVSPVDPVDLPAGRHHVLFRNKELGKERSLTANVVRGEMTTVRVDLLE